MKVIVTGATGMVGEGVLHECLQSDKVTSVLILGRKKMDIDHPKVSQLVVEDMYNIDSYSDKLAPYESCLFCLGTTSVGKTDEEFYKITYTLTLHIAKVLAKNNKAMTFCYISGTGTDSTEKGRVAWARTKGKVENDLKKLGFKAVYNFRPGYLQPTKGMKNTLPYYKYISWMYPLVKLLGVGTKLSELGTAMINASYKGYEKDTIEIKDIFILIS